MLPPKSTARFLVAGLIQNNFLGISETWDNAEHGICGIMQKKIIIFQTDLLREGKTGTKPFSSLAPIIAASNPFGVQTEVLWIFSNTIKIYAKSACKILISKPMLLIFFPWICSKAFFFTFFWNHTLGLKPTLWAHPASLHQQNHFLTSGRRDCSDRTLTSFTQIPPCVCAGMIFPTINSAPQRGNKFSFLPAN